MMNEVVFSSFTKNVVVFTWYLCLLSLFINSCTHFVFCIIIKQKYTLPQNDSILFRKDVFDRL